jgi:hypothetical protein
MACVEAALSQISVSLNTNVIALATSSDGVGKNKPQAPFLPLGVNPEVLCLPLIIVKKFRR